MSDFVEKITLDLDGNVTSGAASKALTGTSEGMGKLLDDLKKLGSETSAASVLGGITAGMVAMAGVGVVAAKALGSVTAAIFGAVKEQENLLITLGATMASTNGWSASMGIAAVQLDKLKETAALVNSTEAQMVETFTMLKRTFGGTSDEAVQLTEKLALLARQSGASVDTLAQRLASASITGTLMTRGAAGIALVGAGIDPQELMRMKDAGQAMEYLNAKIADNPELVERLKDTWSYLGAELSKVQQQAEETVGQGLDPLKAVLKDLIASLDSAESRAAFATFGANLHILNEQLVSLLPSAQIGTSFFASLGTNVLKGLNVLLADLILIGKELSVAVGGIWDVITNPHKYFGSGGKERLQVTLNAIVKLYEENQAKILKIVGTSDAFIGPPAPEKSTVPGAERVKKIKNDLVDIAAKQDLAIGKYNEWAALFKEKLDLAGLDGLDLALARTNLQFDKGAEEIRKHTAAVAEIDSAAVAAEKGLLAMNEAARQSALALDISKAAEDFEKGISLMESSVSFGMGDMMTKMTDMFVKDAQKIENGFQQAFKAIGAMPIGDLLDPSYVEKLAAYLDKLGRLDASYLSSKRKNQESYDLAMKTMMDEQSGDWNAYYDDLVKSAEKAGRGIVEAMQSSLQTVAEKAYANALTIGDGVQAALRKIRAELKTEGQIWSDYLTGIWGSLAQGFDDAFFSVISGKFDSLKDVLKNLGDSILRDFSKMVTDMVKRWLLGKEQMAGGASPLDSLFQSQKAAIGQAYENQQDFIGPKSQQQRGSTTGTTVAGIAGTAAAGYGIGSAVGSASGAPGWATGATVGGVIGTVIFPGLGTAIGAILGAIIGGLIGVLTVANTEKFIKGSDLAPQMKAVGEAIQGGLLDIFVTSMLPDPAGFAKNMNTSIKDYLLKAVRPDSAGGFKIGAGSSEDIEADVKKLLSGIIPSELLHVLIGQQRIGGQDVAGISGASKYGGALDPTAPINKMLTDLGFTAAKIDLLAGQIDSMAPEEWMKMLSGLVGVVNAAADLGKEVSKTYAETIASADAEAAKSPAGKLSERLTAVTDLMKAVSFYTGTEQITKGQEAIAAAQQFYADAKAAMLQLAAMAKQVTQDVAEATKKVLDSLKTPAELAAQSFSDLQHDYDRMRFAANPEDMAAAWAQARTDFEAVAGELVNRIKQIRSVLDDIHTLQAAMLTGPGPNASTDPGAWLAKNTADMEKYRIAMTAATPGSPEQIAAATSFAGLIRDRYQMELDMLGRVASTIEAIDQSIGASLIELQMQGMGSVVNGKWVPDTHAQGDFMMSQVTALQGQLAGAQTPEEVQRIVSQIQALVGRLGAQQQDPTHYAESLRILAQILKDTQRLADARLQGMGAAAEFDITTLGPKLAAAETIMADALVAAQVDLDALIWHFKRAGDFMTGKLDEWGVEIAAQLNILGPILATMVLNFTDVTEALTGTGTGGGGGGVGKPGLIPVISDATVALGDFSARLRGTSAPGGTGTNSTAGASSAGNVTVTVNLDVKSGTPEDVAAAVGAAVEAKVYPILRSSNTELVRALRNNPRALAR